MAPRKRGPAPPPNLITAATVKTSGVMLSVHPIWPDMQFTQGELFFECTLFLYSVLALFLQYLNIYKTLWWLPKSYWHYSLKFHLINPYFLSCVGLLLGWRVTVCFWKTITEVVSTISTNQTQFIQSSLMVVEYAAIKTPVTTLIITSFLFSFNRVCTDFPSRSVLWIWFPVILYVFIFHSEIVAWLRKFRDLIGVWRKEGTEVSEILDRLVDAPQTQIDLDSVLHMCSDNPIQIREEISVLINDLVLRLKKSVFAGVSTSFFSIILPCIFVPGEISLGSDNEDGEEVEEVISKPKPRAERSAAKPKNGGDVSDGDTPVKKRKIVSDDDEVLIDSDSDADAGKKRPVPSKKPAPKKLKKKRSSFSESDLSDKEEEEEKASTSTKKVTKKTAATPKKPADSKKKQTMDEFFGKKKDGKKDDDDSDVEVVAPREKRYFKTSQGIPQTILINEFWECQLGLVVGLTAFSLYISYLCPLNYLDLLHRAAIHLGSWHQIEGPRIGHMASMNSAPSPWNQYCLYNDGETVQMPDGRCYRAKASSLIRTVAAHPESVRHNTFFKVLRKPNNLINIMCAFELLLIFMQFWMLVLTNDWQHIVTFVLLMFANYLLFAKLFKDKIIISRIYEPSQEDLLLMHQLQQER
uniref:Uncharacterized protein n=1 Tax=Caenorhabditis japonica TaxID=281687 RepID=A0A8R1HJK1_CAEJA